MNAKVAHPPEGATAVSDNFSLMRGGPTYRIVRAFGRLLPGIPLDWAMVVVLLLVAFVPMAWLAWREGMLLQGVAIPLLGDWLLLARFLVAMPLLVLAAHASDVLVRSAVWQLMRGGGVASCRRTRFERVLASATRARNAPFAELACLALAFAPALAPALVAGLSDPVPAGLTTWRFADGEATAAARWLELVAAPLFRFLLLLWLWRLVLWSWMLWRFARIGLDLRATHPDRAGGVAFLGLAQSRFVVLSATGAIVLCGYCANQMVYAGQAVSDLRYLLAGYVVAASALLLAPLLLLSPSLVRAKRHALATYDELGRGLAKAFEKQWRRGAQPKQSTSMLESPAPSALADFSGVYANIVGTSVLPVTRWILFKMLLGAAVPLLPLVFLAMPLDELVQRLVSVLI